MNTILESKIPDVAATPKRSPVRFAVGSVFALVSWPLAVVFVMFISAVSWIFLGREERQKLGQNTLGLILGTFMNCVEGLGIITVSDDELKQHAGMPGPLIIACNHPSLWDALFVIRRVRRVSCIMKTDVQLNPLLGTGARFAGFIPNSPRLKMIREAVKRLKSGDRLLLFPEGTRTREESGAINEFRPGLALMAKQSGASVLPVFISYNSKYLRKGWPIWRMPDLPISISLRVGKVEKIRPDERVRDFSRRLEALFREELG
jgi:1-acyl-sn-glycerol-3-phosphate acyltransferase